MGLSRRVVPTVVVARIERGEIRDSVPIEMPIPDFAALNPGYERVRKSGAARP
jgi:hypothetical protein